MASQGAFKRSILNNQFIGLSHTLSSKRQQRKVIENKEKQLSNKVTKIQQNEKKALKDYEKKFEHLRNIYKIRLQKQQQLSSKQKIKTLKQQKIRSLKAQWREDKGRNVLKLQEPCEETINSNKRCSLSQKRSREKPLIIRYQSVRKTAFQQNPDIKERRKNKQNELYKIIQYQKKFKNVQIMNNYKSMVQKQQQKKQIHLQKIRQLNKKQNKKKIQLQKNLQANSRIQSIISQAYGLDLKQLQKLLMIQNPNKIKRSVSRRSSSQNESQSNLKTQRMNTISNPEIDYQFIKLNNKQRIYQTIMAIQQIQRQETLERSKTRNQYVVKNNQSVLNK